MPIGIIRKTRYIPADAMRADIVKPPAGPGQVAGIGDVQHYLNGGRAGFYRCVALFEQGREIVPVAGAPLR